MIEQNKNNKSHRFGSKETPCGRERQCVCACMLVNVTDGTQRQPHGTQSESHYSDEKCVCGRQRAYMKQKLRRKTPIWSKRMKIGHDRLQSSCLRVKHFSIDYCIRVFILCRSMKMCMLGLVANVCVCMCCSRTAWLVVALLRKKRSLHRTFSGEKYRSILIDFAKATTITIFL